MPRNVRRWLLEAGRGWRRTEPTSASRTTWNECASSSCGAGLLTLDDAYRNALGELGQRELACTLADPCPQLGVIYQPGDGGSHSFVTAVSADSVAVGIDHPIGID